MQFYIDKLLTPFVLPLGASLAGLLFVLVVGMFLGRRLNRIALFAVVLALWAASTPLVASFALRSLERDFPVRPIAEVPTADVVIVLGGSIRAPTRDNPYPDFGESSDRLIHGLRLIKAAKATKLMLVGRGNGWVVGEKAENSAMAALLTDFGIKADVLIIEDSSRNTHENALLAKQLWDANNFTSGLLVTSASHMPRAYRVFKRQRFNVTPVSVDVQAGRFERGLPWALLPDVRALKPTSDVVKEWIGLLVYRLRGWIE